MRYNEGIRTPSPPCRFPTLRPPRREVMEDMPINYGNGVDDFHSDRRSKSGNVFWVRAKEALGWITEFCLKTMNEIHCDSDSGIGKDDIEADNDENLNYEDIGKNNEEPHSEDPFHIYDILNNQKEIINGDTSSENNPKYPLVLQPLCTQDGKSNVPATMKKGDADSCNNFQEGGSVLQVMEELAKIGQIMGYNMEGLAQKAKKDWVKELCNINKVNVLSLQETKMENIELFTIKSCWGNLNFDYVYSPSVGEWIPTGKQTLIISIYAPQELSEKKMLWDYFINVIGNWKRDVVIMGDFNEFAGYGRDSNDISKFSKKLKHLKDKIRVWVKYKKESSNHYTKSLKVELAEIDNLIDKGEGDSEFLNRRIYVTKFLQDIEKLASLEMAQKSKIKWAIEGDENSKFFHGILNKKRSQLAIRGILSDGAWIDSPNLVKKEFLSHFTKRFAKVETPSLQINSNFPKNAGSRSADDIWNTRFISRPRLIGIIDRGQFNLVKSVLGSMPIYNMSLFKVPVKSASERWSPYDDHFNGVDPMVCLYLRRIRRVSVALISNLIEDYRMALPTRIQQNPRRAWRLILTMQSLRYRRGVDNQIFSKDWFGFDGRIKATSKTQIGDRRGSSPYTMWLNHIGIP
ncbi:RNA-directed DNA polymerase, eukaryota [Tanacetum coccineum]|uniref:RNA-directed DNA polymerase, eukaryota n=1 Tax=Tanacetum coccineum TaxID=301880 RepID=A0ABQ5DIU6_9ASTR